MPCYAKLALPFQLTTTDTVASTEHVRQAGLETTVEPKTVELGDITVAIAFFKGSFASRASSSGCMSKAATRHRP